MNERMPKNKKTGMWGFTLIELLIVIAIIGILAAILMPAISGAFKKADVTKAKTEMAGIVAAIKAYFAEYGVMPTPSTNGQRDNTFMGDGGAPNTIPNRLIFDILRGVNTTNNPKRIVFLEVQADSMTTNACYLDPWGNPYIIVMDTDFNGQIEGIVGISYTNIVTMLNNASPSGNGTFPGTIVGVMSYGPEPGSTNSFLKSW